MLQIKLIVKAILKNKMLTGLNIFNLIIAFTGIIILSLYVSFEQSFDNFHQNKDNIYRVETPLYGSNLPLPIRKSVENNIPEIEKITTLWFNHSAISTEELTSQNVTFQSTNLMTDSSFFKIFSFPLVIGNPKGLLSRPNTAILTQTLAHKLFAEANPVGKNILVTGKTYTVVGVMEDFPDNSSFKADVLTSFATKLSYEPTMMDDWSEWSFQFFVQLKQNTNTNLLATKITELENVKDFVEEMKSRYTEGKVIQFTSLEQIHYIKDTENFAYINKKVLNILLLLIVVLAVMGIFNFINFSTSLAPLKAKFLSIFRILGGKRINSMRNIIVESIFISIMALILALILHELSYSFIQNLFKVEGLSLSGRYHYILWFILFAVVFAVLAALYPSIYITSPSLSQTVKGNAYFKNKGKGVRNTFILVQFVLTITLVSSAFVIEKQLNFWSSYNMGIDKENVVYLKLNETLREKYKVLSNEVSQLNEVKDYSYSQFIPGQVAMGWGRYIDGKYINLKAWPVDDRFLDFFGIEMYEGRGFRKGAKADINTFILNKKAVDEFEWDNPFEKEFGMGFNGNVIGIAKNFNFSSLKEDIEPMILWRTDTRRYNLMLRVKTDNYASTFTKITEILRTIDPAYNGEVRFLDDSLNQLYTRERNTARFIEFVALWCILLALTGLTGLVIFISRDRIKEIGIRRVNGAEISEIMMLFNLVFFKWMLIAFVIACPIAYYAMSRWLESFAYKTALSWWIFALSGLLSVAIAIITISWQSWKAATRNPVEALRYE
jgi:putative ABC transport system permease protein